MFLWSVVPTYLITCVISGLDFEVAENCTLLGYYTVSNGKLRNNQEERSSVPNYMIYNPKG